MLRWWRRLEFHISQDCPSRIWLRRRSDIRGGLQTSGVLCKAPGRKRSHLRSADCPSWHSAQHLMTAGALACGWKTYPALGDWGCKLSKLVASLAVQPPQTQPRDLARPCCKSNYPLHADQAPWWPLQSSPPFLGPQGPPGNPDAHSREAGGEACQTAIGGGPRPTVAAGPVPENHPTKPKILIVDIPKGRSVGALHHRPKNVGCMTGQSSATLAE